MESIEKNYNIYTHTQRRNGIELWLEVGVIKQSVPRKGDIFPSVEHLPCNYSFVIRALQMLCLYSILRH